MKINWKVRLKNPAFWITIIPVVIAFVYNILAAFDIFPNVTEYAVTEWLGAIVTALASIGILNDPTTDGLNDSQRALTYNNPYVSEYEDNSDRKGDEE